MTSASTQSPSLSLTKHSVSLVLKFLILRRFNTSAALITYSSLVWTCHLWILEVHFILSFHYKVHYFSLHFSFLMYVPPLIPCISSVAVFIHLQELHHLSPCMCVCVCATCTLPNFSLALFLFLFCVVAWCFVSCQCIDFVVVFVINCYCLIVVFLWSVVWLSITMSTNLCPHVFQARHVHCLCVVKFLLAGISMGTVVFIMFKVDRQLCWSSCLCWVFQVVRCVGVFVYIYCLRKTDSFVEAVYNMLAVYVNICVKVCHHEK